jgi:hypothetical protein
MVSLLHSTKYLNNTNAQSIGNKNKNIQMKLHQTIELLNRKRSNREYRKETTCEMEENISESNI